MSVKATMEVPLSRRAHERFWKIPDINRICVSADCSSELPVLMQIALEIMPCNGSLVMEAEEMWSSKRQVVQTTGLDICEISDFDTDTIESLTRDAKRRIALHCGGGCYVFFPDRELFERLPVSLSAKEWYGYAPPASSFVPYSLREEAMRFTGYFDQFVLENVGDADLVFFLSPNHLHLEIMTIDTPRIARVLRGMGIPSVGI